MELTQDRCPLFYILTVLSLTTKIGMAKNTFIKFHAGISLNLHGTENFK